jgi:hypothetical protein
LYLHNYNTKGEKIDLNPKQIRCAYWLLHDFGEDYELISFTNDGSAIETEDGKTLFWLLLIFSNSDTTLKAYINEEGLPFILEEI